MPSVEFSGSRRPLVFAPLSDRRAAAVVEAMRGWCGDHGPDPVALVTAIAAFVFGLAQRPPREVLLAHLYPIADLIDRSHASAAPIAPLTRHAVIEAVLAVYDALEPLL